MTITADRLQQVIDGLKTADSLIDMTFSQYPRVLESLRLASRLLAGLPDVEVIK